MQGSAGGFTKIDLLFVVLAIGILGSLTTVGLLKSNEKARRIRCVNNLKQSALGFKIFSSDCGDRYPYQTEPALSLTTPHAIVTLTNVVADDVSKHAAWMHWGFMSNEIGSPKVLHCPGNRLKKHTIATDWTDNNQTGFFSGSGYERMKQVSRNQDQPDYGNESGYDISTSYFVCLNAEETIPNGVIAGDSNLSWNDLGGAVNPVNAGAQFLNSTNHFSDILFAHGRDSSAPYRHHKVAGNIALTDGSVSIVNNDQLQQLFQASTNAHGINEHWLVIPR